MPHSNLPIRTALITGTSRRLGLGFAVARQLAEQGYRVFLTARNASQAEALVAELREAGLHVDALRLDVTDPASILELVTDLGERIDHLDVLINNASVMPDFERQSALNVDTTALRPIFDVSVFGCWGVTQALLPLLRRAPAARIVNVSSAAVHQIDSRDPAPVFAPAYSLAKYTLNVLTRTLATALADTSILINAVDPGSVATHPERGDDADDRPPAEAAKGVVWAATLDDGGPSGGFFHDGHPSDGSSW